MAIFGCNNKRNCALIALIVSAIVGVLTAFLHITGVVTATPLFVGVLGGIAIVYLAVLVIAAALARRAETTGGPTATINLLLAGILGTILFAVVLLAVGITATGVLTALLVGALLFFFTLMLTATACYVRFLTGVET